MLTNSKYPPSPSFIMIKSVDTASYLDLEKVVQVYGKQPELLELILSSKVEEDRRGAEEAKLRRKEINYMLQQKKTATLPSISKKFSSTKRKNSIEMLLSPPEFGLKLPEIQNHYNKKRLFSNMDDNDLPVDSVPPSPPPSESKTPLKRKRREVHPITAIVETKEFPYNDDYLWKNNGNTIHKKSGYKSIYYKCSNSTKGCPINKTVTFKENGDHLIKYRGEHLSECSRVKRITSL